jgi:hypothetical protein
MGMYLTSLYLMGMYLTSLYLMGVHLISVYLTGMHLIGVYLMGVHLTDVYFMDVYIPNLPLYERWSIYRDLSCKIRVFALQGLGASDCKRGIARTRRKPKTANRLTTICGWAFRSMLELASIWRVPNFSLAIGCA